MSHKQAKGRKKGGDDYIKVVGNTWEGFKKMWMECGSDECDVWMPIKAPDGWSGENDEFRCGVGRGDWGPMSHFLDIREYSRNPCSYSFHIGNAFRGIISIYFKSEFEWFSVI